MSIFIYGWLFKNYDCDDCMPHRVDFRYISIHVYVYKCMYIYIYIYIQICIYIYTYETCLKLCIKMCIYEFIYGRLFKDYDCDDCMSHRIDNRYVNEYGRKCTYVCI
jgi:hypothetical protein